ncbi:MAG: hypothetical protein AAB701_00295 [Patescibacteria group bacterium]
MADTNDQNQIGPPMAAAVPDPVGTTTTTDPPAGGITNEHLQTVTALVETFADLVTVVREVDDRTRILERDRREALGISESPELTRIWVSAIEPLVQYLTQPIQLSAGAKPIQLADAAEQLATLVSTFRENAVGPDGQGLQQDPGRLRAFEAKLSGVDPSPNWIEQEGQRLLIRPELDPTTVRRTVAATLQSQTDEEERTAAIKQTLMSFDQEWEASIPALEDSLRERRDELQLLISTPSNSDHLKQRANEGLQIISAINTNSLVASRVSLGEWVEKYRTDPTFTSEQVGQRINHELRPMIRAFQSKVEDIERQWTAETLRTTEQVARKQEGQTRLEELDAAIEQVRARYTALVNLRRIKLGQEPDERFFGEIARLVNTAITDLGNLEADLLAARTTLQTTEVNPVTQALRTRIAFVMKQSDDYADTEHMERRLAAQAKAIERETLRAAAHERQLAKERAKEAQRQQQEAERRTRSEVRRQQHLDRQQRSNSHVKAAQQLLDQHQSLDAELRAYVTELTEASQERERHAATITSLIASERQSLDEDRQQFLESKAERRALTASEATAWLASLAERERLLDQRQERLTQLAQELRSLEATTANDRRLTRVRERLAETASTSTIRPTDPTATTTQSAETDEPVRIAIGRRQ